MSQSEVVSDKQDSVNNVPESENSTNSKKPSDKQKVDIFLKPTGNAPIMKTKKWTVDSDKPIGWIIEFVKKYLKLETNEKLVNILITGTSNVLNIISILQEFVYVNQTFAPSPDQIVRNLYDCYSTEGKLVLHYCTTQAWG